MGRLDIKSIKSKAIVIKEPDFSYVDGKYLRDFRMRMKMSQALFADYLGVTKKAIEKWEQGKNKVNPVVCRMIYLMEKDPHIFSMLKEVSYEGNSIEVKPSMVFIPSSVENNTSIKANNDYVLRDSCYSAKWEGNTYNNGGITNGTSSI
ncbi:MAG: helix-turn-helix domain-containing protein [Acholeplasmatales bacterium]|nr:helix-turn-helix domain-containing protein [Acholeplasmatales bacterium]